MTKSADFYNLKEYIYIKRQKEPQQTDEYCKEIGAELREDGYINTTDDQVYKALKSIFENDFDSENYIVKRLLGDEVNNG